MPIHFRNKRGNKLHSPKTITQAIERIVAGLDPTEKDFIMSNDCDSVHFSLGMTIRNQWGLWKTDSAIKRDFRNRFKLFGHADDISGIILSGVWASVIGNDVEQELAKAADQYRRHWKKSGVDPESGESRNFGHP